MNINIDSYVYGDSSSVSDLLISTSIVPNIVLEEFPSLHSNSAQAYFKFKVKSSDGINLPNAQAYYRTDLTGAYIPLSLEREIGPYVVGEGQNIIDIKAEVNGVWTNVFVYEWTVDLQPPTFTNSSPVSGAIDVNAQGAVTINFSETVQSNPILTLNAIQITPAVAGTWSGGGSSYTFTPLSRFEYETEYTFILTDDIQDLAGNIYNGNDTIAITIAAKPNFAPEPPTFDGIINPSNNSDGKPHLIFNVPEDEDGDGLHFTVDVVSETNFVRRYSSVEYPESFIYYPSSGTRIEPYPINGVVPLGGKVVFVMPISLPSGDYSFTVFADDRR